MEGVSGVSTMTVPIEQAQGHWVLARMGKRVLRPGGKELTLKLIDALTISGNDEVIEFAPGLGFTASIVLSKKPASYLGVERDEVIATELEQVLKPHRNARIVIGNAEHTTLPDQSATVVYGEAMLTMQSNEHKQNIVREAYRLLKAQGRYGIHELCLVPDDISKDLKNQIHRDLATAIRVNARPLTISEWRSLLEKEGFEVIHAFSNPMHLLEPKRLIDDEGLLRFLKIGFNILTHPKIRMRVLQMRNVFRRYKDYLGAVALVGRKIDRISTQN